MALNIFPLAFSLLFVTVFFYREPLASYAVSKGYYWSASAQEETCTGDVCTLDDKTIPRGANVDGRPRVAEKDCKDRNKNCEWYASQGECEKNPGWMIMFCAASCNACHLRKFDARCSRKKLNISEDPVYAPGDMETMFSSLHEKYNDRYGVNILSTSPWVVTFDNFVSEEEVTALLETNMDSFERSTDTGSANEFGETGRVLSTRRTSSNSWCRDKCEKHPHVSNLMAKIEEVTGVPRGHYESFQVLQYLEGQRYGEHHDYGASDRGLPSGPRILTFFLYLSDVEEGGSTGFPGLGIDVVPKKGKALLWPSTVSDNPEMKEHRTNHEAKAVIKGVKYAANSWIHLYDYAIPNLWGCTGTFDEPSD